MAFTEQDGNVDGIPVSLYWILVRMSPERVYTPERIITDEQGNKLDITGKIIPEYEYKSADFAYTPGKEQLETTLVFHAFISQQERVDLVKNGKPPRKVKRTSFKEDCESVIELSGNLLSFYYNHPLFSTKIPAGWVSDEI